MEGYPRIREESNASKAHHCMPSARRAGITYYTCRAGSHHLHSAHIAYLEGAGWAPLSGVEPRAGRAAGVQASPKISGQTNGMLGGYSALNSVPCPEAVHREASRGVATSISIPLRPIAPNWTDGPAAIWPPRPRAGAALQTAPLAANRARAKRDVITAQAAAITRRGLILDASRSTPSATWGR